MIYLGVVVKQFRCKTIQFSYFLQKGCVERLHKRTYIFAVILALLFALSVAGSGLAEDDNIFRHSATYDIGGRISLEREVGDFCTTGAALNQSVNGYGAFTRSENIRIANNIIDYDEVSNWTTAVDAIRNLTVATTIRLCAKGMYENEDGEIVFPYTRDDGFDPTDLSALTRQIWAVSVTPDRGQSGSMSIDMIAAYGPYDTDEEDDYSWWIDDEGNYQVGRKYVGNYFEIDQYAYTSNGDTRRFTSMSSPFSNTYFTQELQVLGMAEIRESFELDNLEPGPDAISFAWWSLF